MLKFFQILVGLVSSNTVKRLLRHNVNGTGPQNYNKDLKINKVNLEIFYHVENSGNRNTRVISKDYK